MARRYYSSTAVATTLSGNINNSTTSISVAALTGYPAQTPWTAVLEPDTVNEEVVEVTNVSGTTLTVTRGVDGTSAVAHDSGVKFQHGVSARDFDEANAFVNGGGIPSTALTSTAPANLASTASAGSSTDVARRDHVHAFPSASDVGAVANSLFANKGTIAAASAASTPAALSVGSNGQMLMADSSATAGLRYVDPPANRNLLINGAMQVAQRGTSVTGITGTAYNTADRWRLGVSSMGTWTETVETDAPTGSGLRRSVKVLCTTADNSPAAGDVVNFSTQLEGQDVQRIRKGTSAAEQLTVSFWVKSNATGTYVCEVVDNDNSRHVAATYTISASATWERKTLTFPADTTGALDNDNASSLVLLFYLGAGSDRTSGTLATTWASLTTANRAVGQTNLAAATNNYWQITGVQLETGPVATPFEFEPYEATLRKCQRYYYLHVSGTAQLIGSGTYTDSNTVTAYVHFPTTMRTAPSLTATTGTNYYALYTAATSYDYFNDLTIAWAQTNAAGVYTTSNVSGTAGFSGDAITANASSSVAFGAEL